MILWPPRTFQKKKITVIIMAVMTVVIFLAMYSRHPGLIRKVVTNKLSPGSLDRQTVIIPGVQDDEPPARYTAAIRRPSLVIFTLFTNDYIEPLAELVGSMHHQYGRESPPIFVFGSGSSESAIQEISAWESVTYFDLKSFIHGWSSNTTHEDTWNPDQAFLISLLHDRLTLQYDVAVYADNGLAFASKMRLHRLIERIFMSGYVLVGHGAVNRGELNFIVQGFTRSGFVRRQKSYLDCRRGIRCQENTFDPSLQYTLSEEFAILHNIASKTSTTTNRYSCFIDYRQDLLYDVKIGPTSMSKFYETDESIFSQTKKTKIAIGVPILSTDENARSHYLVSSFSRTFLKALLLSLTPEEEQAYLIVVYVGYVSGDSIFDNRSLYDETRRFFSSIVDNHSVVIKYHRLPAVRSLTFRWNRLMTDAFGDGCQYYYQLHDHAELLSGWLSLYVGEMRRMDDFGVLGPVVNQESSTEPKKCRYEEAAFVSAKHFATHAWFYPPTLIDPIGQDWFERVYGNRAKCLDTTFVRGDNVVVEPPCHYLALTEEAIAVGRTAIERYMTDVEKGLRK